MLNLDVFFFRFPGLFVDFHSWVFCKALVQSSCNRGADSPKVGGGRSRSSSGICGAECGPLVSWQYARPSKPWKCCWLQFLFSWWSSMVKWQWCAFVLQNVALGRICFLCPAAVFMAQMLWAKQCYCRECSTASAWRLHLCCTLVPFARFERTGVWLSNYFRKLRRVCCRQMILAMEQLSVHVKRLWLDGHGHVLFTDSCSFLFGVCR